MFCACVLKLNDDIIATPTFLHPRIRQRERCSAVKPSSRRNCLVPAKMVTLTGYAEPLLLEWIQRKQSTGIRSQKKKHRCTRHASMSLLGVVGIDPPPPPSPHPHRSTLLSAVKNYLITIYIIYVKTFRSSRSLSLSQAPPHIQGVVTHTCIPAVLTPTTGIKI